MCFLLRVLYVWFCMMMSVFLSGCVLFFFFQAEDGIRDKLVTGVQTCALPISSAMLMQNHGFLAAINGIVSCGQLYRIPLLMLISQRGSFGEKDPWQTEGGGVTEHVLEALRIPFDRLEAAEQVRKRIAKAQTLAYS